MPPTRTMAPAKPVKTERTHEENQERAYIAASRRSDRSLEARIESARRASEIHKRRTGRSLRVTEQNVINEEMYEEEDDDLPLHYRRLTAHLQTGSIDFDRRLAAYLTNQLAMRSAMDRMINNSYAQQFPNAPQFAHNDSMGGQHSPTTAQTGFVQSPTLSYRSAPYPSPHQTNFRNLHARSSSIAVPSDFSRPGVVSPSQQPTPPPLGTRRMSMPASTLLATHSPSDSCAALPATTSQLSMPHYPPLGQDHSMFTTILPPESQQMLAPVLDPNDPLTASLMSGSEHFISSPHYPWGSQQPGKANAEATHSTFNGMPATLDPSAMDNDATATTTSDQRFHSNMSPSTSIDFNLSLDSVELKGMSSTPGSGLATPGDTFWDSYIQDPVWDTDTGAS